MSDGIAPETGIPRPWDNAVPVSRKTGGYTVHSSTPEYGSEELVSVSGCYTSTLNSTDCPKGPECGSKSWTDQSCVSEAWWTLGW